MHPACPPPNPYLPFVREKNANNILYFEMQKHILSCTEYRHHSCVLVRHSLSKDYAYFHNIIFP